MPLVLVVEDSREAREGLRILLRRGGYDSVGVGGGREALARLAAGPVDLMLLDLSMPDVDGFEVLRHLPAAGEGRRPPVVVFTALDDSDSVRRARELGADEYLVKGRVTWRQVIERVRHHLGVGGTPAPPVGTPPPPEPSGTTDATASGTEAAPDAPDADLPAAGRASDTPGDGGKP